MRVLHVASSYPLTSGDHTAPFMEEMLGALSDAGHEVSVLLPSCSGLERGLRSGVRVETFPYAPPSLQHWGYGRSLAADGSIRRGAFLVAPSAMSSMLIRTRTLVRRFRPDILHIHWVLPQGVVALALSADIPVVVSMHGADAKLVRHPRLSGVARRILRRADHVIAASSPILEVGRAIEPTIARRSSVVPHGANAALFGGIDRSEARPLLGLPLGKPLVLAVGRLVPKKGLDRLISTLAETDPDVRLAIAGEGPLLSDLELQAGSVAPGRIQFLGALARQDLASWYGAADVVVIPSVPHAGDIDSGPVVLTEAMAAGRPVVATAVGMAPDLVVDGENGYLIADPTPSSLAGAIMSCLEHADIMGAHALETFNRAGDWSRVAHQLGEIYVAAASRRSNL